MLSDDIQSQSSLDVDSVRYNRSERKSSPIGILNLDCMSPKTRFVYESFSNKENAKHIILGGPKSSATSNNEKLSGNNIAEGEVIKDVYACAI